MRARPANNFCRRALHPLDEVEQDAVSLFHRFLVDDVGRTDCRDDEAVTLKRTRLDCIALNAVHLIHELVAAFVH